MADADPRYAWRQELAATGTWVRRTPVRRLVLPMTTAVVITAFCLLMAVVGGVGGLVVGIPGVLFSGCAMLPVLVWRARTGKPVLRLDRGGIQLDRVGVPWSEVSHVGLYSLNRVSTVVVGLTPAGEARRDALSGGVMRVLGGMNDRLTRGPALHVPNGYGLPAPLLAQWIDEVRVGSSGGWASPSPGLGW